MGPEARNGRGKNTLFLLQSHLTAAGEIGSLGASLLRQTATLRQHESLPDYIPFPRAFFILLPMSIPTLPCQLLTNEERLGTRPPHYHNPLQLGPIPGGLG